MSSFFGEAELKRIRLNSLLRKELIRSPPPLAGDQDESVRIL